MREQKLFANLKKCFFAANEIPFLGCIVGKNGVRPDPEKIKAISKWPVPIDVKGLRKFIKLAAYLRKYSGDYADFESAQTEELSKGWLAESVVKLLQGVHGTTRLAQLVERWPFKPVVVGWSPTGVSPSFNSCAATPHVLHTVFTTHGCHYGVVKLLQGVHGTTRLAQLVERWPFKPVVVGSSPTGGVTLFQLVRCHADVAMNTVMEWLSFFQSNPFGVDSSPPGRRSRHVLHTVFTTHGCHYGVVKLLQGVHGTTRLAQLVERWPFKPVVVGSSPTGVSPSFNSCAATPHVLHTVFTTHGCQYSVVKLLQGVHGTTRLAQLVERWPFKPVVVGSSPTGGVTLFQLVRCHADVAMNTVMEWLSFYQSNPYVVDSSPPGRRSRVKADS
uniref:Uncharacterized protein n=1 Tax=Peronospora matthiolae TaxID=2874970 RepID=A0AAV1VGK7_9STRA